ncbi:hypothetical protein C8R42DRAFT_638265 [Lentinula raphanica]|nr:hypothetical protein C8R42DRAFT_638265 [Lentinula raphanica]
MIRALRARNFSKRPTLSLSPTENTPPGKPSPKSASARVRRVRTRKHNKNLTAAEFDAEQAKKKAKKAKKTTTTTTTTTTTQTNQSVRLNVVLYGSGENNVDVDVDVEMQDVAGPSCSQQQRQQQPSIVPVMLPRALNQPPVCEPSDEAIAAATGPSYCGQPAAFVRDELQASGPRSLRTLCSVQTQVINPSVLPKELPIVVTDRTAVDYPTHMLAVYAPVPKKPSNASPQASWVPPKTDVKMYPVHALFLAAHCGKLGPFPPSPSLSPSPSAFESELAVPASEEEPRTLTVPVRPLCLPSPPTFPHLLHYFYLRRPEVLFRAFFPCEFSTDFVRHCTSSSSSPSPSSESESESEKEIHALATHIGQTFTPGVILKHTKVIHGVWQNACALGAVDEGLWGAIGVGYEVMLGALAVGAVPREVYVAMAKTPGEV